MCSERVVKKLDVNKPAKYSQKVQRFASRTYNMTILLLCYRILLADLISCVLQCSSFNVSTSVISSSTTTQTDQLSRLLLYSYSRLQCPSHGFYAPTLRLKTTSPAHATPAPRFRRAKHARDRAVKGSCFDLFERLSVPCVTRVR
jgi:hypothetical protein